MSNQTERNTAALQAVHDAVQDGAKLNDAIAVAGVTQSGFWKWCERHSLGRQSNGPKVMPTSAQFKNAERETQVGTAAKPLPFLALGAKAFAQTGAIRAVLSAGVELPAPRPPITTGDLLVALAIYAHAGTEDFVNPVCERDFSAFAILYFSKYPERLDLVAMRAHFTTFVHDDSGIRQHPKLEDVMAAYSLASEDVQNEFFQIFVDQCVWVRRHKAGEFK